MTMYEAGENRRDPGITSENSLDMVEENNWLVMVRDALKVSEDYFEANIRASIERNLAHFNNKHAPGSKYYTDSYKHRARGFRPKTRSTVRKNETAAAIAMFSTADVLSVEAENNQDEGQRVSAEINQELLQYRLDNTVKWFMTAQGAYQDTLVSGVCISHQYWDFQELENEVPMMDPETGEAYLTEDGEEVIDIEREIVADTPAVELRPIENVLFSTAADWRDPLNTSPFLIDKVPMTIDEVKQRSRQTSKTTVQWFNLEDSVLMAGVTTDNDPVRAAREGRREDSKDQRYTTTGFETVWVHRNIVRKEGIDWLFYTLEDHAMLSEPVPLREEYPWLRAGQRPYVLGVSNIETHKNYPEALTGMVSTIQQSANDVQNQRMDNVLLVLNRRYWVKRGAQTDYRALQRNVPGGVTLTNDPNSDIKSDAPPEVTGSSYQEQDRANMDFDDLAGAFSTSSVAANRNLNETVGGMSLLSDDANSITEYQLRIFVETWVEPVMKQLIQLEQMFETDEAILSMVGEKVQLWKRYGVSQIEDSMLQGNMSVKVNVGFGATNPQQRVNKLVFGINSILGFAPDMAMRLDKDELATEVLGALGYRGSDRFFPQLDDEEQAAMAQPPPDPALQVEQFRAETQMQIEQFRAEQDKARMDVEAQVKAMEAESKMAAIEREAQVKQMLAEYALQSDMMELAGKKEITLEQIKAKLGEVALKEKGTNDRMLAEFDFANTIGDGRGI